MLVTITIITVIFVSQDYDTCTSKAWSWYMYICSFHKAPFLSALFSLYNKVIVCIPMKYLRVSHTLLSDKNILQANEFTCRFTCISDVISSFYHFSISGYCTSGNYVKELWCLCSCGRHRRSLHAKAKIYHNILTT